MTFCRKCWTSYDPKGFPAECPHIDGPYMVIGGVPRSVESLKDNCSCGNCSVWDAYPEDAD